MKVFWREGVQEELLDKVLRELLSQFIDEIIFVKEWGEKLEILGLEQVLQSSAESQQFLLSIFRNFTISGPKKLFLENGQTKEVYY